MHENWYTLPDKYGFWKKIVLHVLSARSSYMMLCLLRMQGDFYFQFLQLL